MLTQREALHLLGEMVLLLAGLAVLFLIWGGTN